MIRKRIEAFTREIDHMACYRADNLADFVILNDGSRIELGLMPTMPAALVGPQA